MARLVLVVASLTAGLLSALVSITAHAQQPPLFTTSKVDGTDGVYTFRYQNSLSMFIVTPAGVIVTDPIGYGRPQAVQTYLEEIRKITDKPIKYVLYSHHHFDHIAGGKPFKDAGARFISHKRAKERLLQLADPHTVIPDETFDTKKVITLGGTTVEMLYMGINHSDSTVVMRLPKEKIIFTVDTVAAGQFPGRGMIDSYPIEWEAFLQKLYVMDWERFIPGHPGVKDRLGTKQDVQVALNILQTASAAVKAEAQQGKCWDPVEKEMKLPQFAGIPGYEGGLQFVLRRYCGLWGRGT